MSKIIIHIGYPKTGTTFLQEEVFPSIKDISFLKSHNPLKHTYRRNIDYKKVLISDEGLIGDLFQTYTKGTPFDDFKAKMGLMKELFHQPTILISFRNHSGFIWSLYKQYLNQGGTLKHFNDFFNLNDTGIIKIDEMYYCRRLDFLNQLFNNVISYDYELMKSDLDGTFLNQLCSDLGITAPKKLVRKNMNSSISTEFQKKTLIKLNKLNHLLSNKLNNKYFNRLGINPRAITHKMNRVPSNKLNLRKEIKESIERRFKEDWELLNNKMTYSR